MKHQPYYLLLLFLLLCNIQGCALFDGISKQSDSTPFRIVDSTGQTMAEPVVVEDLVLVIDRQNRIDDQQLNRFIEAMQLDSKQIRTHIEKGLADEGRSSVLLLADIDDKTRHFWQENQTRFPQIQIEQRSTHRFPMGESAGHTLHSLTKQAKEFGMADHFQGGVIHLTIDAALQKHVERTMEEKGYSGAVVIMEVSSGRVLALASSPGIDPNHLVDGEMSREQFMVYLNDFRLPLINKVVQNRYPPGAIFSLVSGLAGLADRKTRPGQEYQCTGSYQLHNEQFVCRKHGGHGKVNLITAFAQGCDNYFLELGLHVGIESLASHASRLGLDQKSGVELQGEKTGSIPIPEWKWRKNKKTWTIEDTLQASVGQGFVFVSPIQVCRMTAAIANGGQLYRPQLIEQEKVASDENLNDLSPHLAVLRKGMTEAVGDSKGYLNQWKMDSLSLAAITGISHVVRLKSVRQNQSLDELPYKHRDHVWFTGFAPAEKPEIAVTVLIEHGHTEETAMEVGQALLKGYFAAQLAPPSEVDPRK